MKNYLEFMYQNKKLLFLITFLVLLILGLVLLLAFQRTEPTDPLPVITFQTSPSPTPMPYIPEQNYQTILQKEIKDLHWLNNTDIAYTFFSETIKKRALAKINVSSSEENILLQDPNLKLSEVYWSNQNNLIIFDYGNPYTTYLFDYSSNRLSETDLKGYGYSWSPDGRSIFFYDDSSDLPSAKIYNLETNSFSSLSINNLPNFQISYWSKDPNKILLYNFDLELNRGELNTLNLSDNSINNIRVSNLVFPSLSPSGEKLAYVSDGGIYIVINNSSQNLVYSTATSSEFISFGWIDDNRLIVFDGEKTTDQFVLISIQPVSQRPVLQEIKTQMRQRAQFAISPDSNTIAIALDKDGLWIVKKIFLE